MSKRKFNNVIGLLQAKIAQAESYMASRRNSEDHHMAEASRAHKEGKEVLANIKEMQAAIKRLS